MPQFGRSMWNVMRSRGEVFGEDSSIPWGRCSCGGEGDRCGRQCGVRSYERVPRDVECVSELSIAMVPSALPAGDDSHADHTAGSGSSISMGHMHRHRVCRVQCSTQSGNSMRRTVGRIGGAAESLASIVGSSFAATPVRHEQGAPVQKLLPWSSAWLMARSAGYVSSPGNYHFEGGPRDGHVRQQGAGPTPTEGLPCREGCFVQYGFQILFCSRLPPQAAAACAAGASGWLGVCLLLCEIPVPTSPNPRTSMCFLATCPLKRVEDSRGDILEPVLRFRRCIYGCGGFEEVVVVNPLRMWPTYVPGRCPEAVYRCMHYDFGQRGQAAMGCPKEAIGWIPPGGGPGGSYHPPRVPSYPPKLGCVGSLPQF